MPDGSLRSDIEGSSYEGYSNIRDNNHSDFINTEGLSSEAYSNSSFRDFSNEVSRNNSDEGMSEQKDKKASKSAAPSSSDFFNPLESMDNESVLKGIIYSEILGKPVSKRKGSRF